MIGAEQHRLALARPPIRPQIQTHVEWLRRQLHDVDGELRTVVTSRPAAKAYYVEKQEQGVSERELSTQYLGGGATPQA